MPPPAAEPTKRAHDEADRLAGIDGDDSDKKRPAKINRTLSGSPAAASRMGPSHPAAVHGNHTNFTMDASMRQAWQPVQQALPGQRHPMATKLEKLTGYGTTVKGTFELNKVLTHQLTALRSSKSENVDIVDMGDFCEPLFCYNNLPTEKKEGVHATGALRESQYSRGPKIKRRRNNPDKDRSRRLSRSLKKS